MPKGNREAAACTMSGLPALAQCWHKPLHCINTAESRSVGFCGGEKCHLNETETETKGKERQPRGCGLRLKRIHPSGRYFCDVPCPLFSLCARHSICAPAFSPFSIPAAPARTPQHSLCERRLKEQLKWISFSACRVSRLSTIRLGTTSLPVVHHVRTGKNNLLDREEDRGDHRGLLASSYQRARARESLGPQSVTLGLVGRNCVPLEQILLSSRS